MKIENYDTQEEESNFKQIYQFIFQDVVMRPIIT